MRDHRPAVDRTRDPRAGRGRPDLERQVELRVEEARVADATAVVALRDAAARRLQRRGIEQWLPGEMPVSHVERAARADELLVVRDGAEIRAAVLLTWADPVVWGLQEEPAGYVHSLVTDGRPERRGLGARLLRWVEARVAASGRTLVRLDCVESSARLRAWYRERGYREVGRTDFGPGTGVHAATRFEKALGREAAPAG